MLNKNPTFSEALKHYRDKERISQEELARRAGLSHSFITLLELGSRNPSRKSAISLAEALNLDSKNTERLLQSAMYAYTPHIPALNNSASRPSSKSNKILEKLSPELRPTAERLIIGFSRMLIQELLRQERAIKKAGNR